jgi:hypothetical protein
MEKARSLPDGWIPLLRVARTIAEPSGHGLLASRELEFLRA